MLIASEWRAAPELNGGLLLDGAVHGIAVLRMLLGPGHDFATTCSFSNSLQSHLPAPDTLDAIVTTQNGVNGTMQISYGTTFQGPIFEIACENGVVLVEGFHAVRVMENEKEPQHLTAHGIEVSVAAVVEAWVKAIVDGGETSKSLLPSEALIDLRVVKCFRIHHSNVELSLTISRLNVCLEAQSWEGSQYRLGDSHVQNSIPLFNYLSYLQP